MKTEVIRMRVSEDEKRIAENLASDYGLKMSEFFRKVIAHLRTERPELVIEDDGYTAIIKPKGKASPHPETVTN